MSLRARARAGSVRAALAAVAVSGALALAGCGDTNVAAKFDGHVVTESEVAQVVADVNEAYQPQAPFTAQQALASLIRAPYLIDYAEQHGFPQTASMARTQIPLQDPSDATVRVLQSTAAIDHLSQADQLALTKVFNDLEVEVNPKYGSYDATQATIAGVTPAWLEFSDDNG